MSETRFTAAELDRILKKAEGPPWRLSVPTWARAGLVSGMGKVLAAMQAMGYRIEPPAPIPRN